MIDRVMGHDEDAVALWECGGRGSAQHLMGKTEVGLRGGCGALCRGSSGLGMSRTQLALRMCMGRGGPALRMQGLLVRLRLSCAGLVWFLNRVKILGRLGTQCG